MGNTLLNFTVVLALGLASLRGVAAESPASNPSIYRPAPAIRGEPITPLKPVTNAVPQTTGSTNSALRETLARARAVAEAMHTNGFRTNASGHLVIGFETLSQFKCDTYAEIEPPHRYPVVKLRGTVPDPVRALDGKRVAISGFMLPLRTSAAGCTNLLLMRDQASCCFGRVPKINHWIHVTTPAPGFRAATGYSITVLGTLRVGPFIQDGSIISLYEMQGDKLELPDYR